MKRCERCSGRGFDSRPVHHKEIDHVGYIILDSSWCIRGLELSTTFLGQDDSGQNPKPDRKTILVSL
jgi:hypothetical protein